MKTDTRRELQLRYFIPWGTVRLWCLYLSYALALAAPGYLLFRLFPVLDRWAWLAGIPLNVLLIVLLYELYMFVEKKLVEVRWKNRRDGVTGNLPTA